MGVMICEVHDRVDFVETCSHVAQRLDQSQVPSGHRLTILGNLFICEECFEALGFARFASLAALPLEDAVEVQDGRRELLDATYERIEGRRPFCLKCISWTDATNA